MPVTYQIDAATAIIRTKCSGDVTLDEVIGHFHELERDPHRGDRLDVMLDLSEQTSIPQSGDLRVVTREIGNIRASVQFGACAIVACTDVLFGMIRMFQVFTEDLFREVCVFRSVPEAEEWLAGRRDFHNGSSNSPTTP